MPSPESSRAQMQPQSPKPPGEKPAEKSQAELREALHEKFKLTKAFFDDAMAEYKAAAKDGTFEDRDGEEEGAGEKRKLALQTKIRKQIERAEGMKRQLDSGEELPQLPDEEAPTEAMTPFMLDFFENAWGWDITNLTPEGHAIAPQSQSYEALSRDLDATKKGEYTLNPETQGLDFESLHTFVPDLSSLNGTPVHEVMQHVVDTYGTTHHIPGIEYWKWLRENPTKTPQGGQVKDGSYYFFPGSVLRDDGGGWNVPCANWGGSEWLRSADWLTGTWVSSYRVVLLKP